MSVNTNIEDITKGIQYILMHSLYVHIIPANQLTSLEDVKQTAIAHGHDSFVAGLLHYQSKWHNLQSCVQEIISAFKKTSLYCRKQTIITLIENSITFSVKENSIILLDDNARIQSNSNINIYIAWWNLHHIGHALTQKCIQDISNPEKFKGPFDGAGVVPILKHYLAKKSVENITTSILQHLNTIQTATV